MIPSEVLRPASSNQCLFTGSGVLVQDCGYSRLFSPQQLASDWLSSTAFKQGKNMMFIFGCHVNNSRS
ncbi:hypothetical protein Q1695_002449 [Nippostrongylus brasiliensis]|nr:hypothetical protein Q1695_002449 [Nippostrongylus brasiliensis]